MSCRWITTEVVKTAQVCWDLFVVVFNLCYSADLLVLYFGLLGSAFCDYSRHVVLEAPLITMSNTPRGTPRVTRLWLVRCSPWGGQGYPLLAHECITLTLVFVSTALCSSLFVGLSNHSLFLPILLHSQSLCAELEWFFMDGISASAWAGLHLWTRAWPTCQWVVDGA